MLRYAVTSVLNEQHYGAGAAAVTSQSLMSTER